MPRKSVTTTRKRKAPLRDQEIVVGQSRINPGDFRELNQAWKGRDLTLFLGAGVSMPYGVPPWRDLVLEMLYDQAAKARRFKPLWPHYLRALTSWMADYFDYNPVVLARLVEHEMRNFPDPADAFVQKLREHLYSRCYLPTEDTSLRALARMIKAARSQRNIAAVFSFNFDDLLEQELRRLGVPVAAMSKASRLKPGEVNIIHPHGFVPQKGAAVRKGLVFTEDDYHDLSDTTFHWALTEIVAHLRQNRALFIGLSMSDPNLRRLLDASRFEGDRPWHWQIQKRHQVGAAAIHEVKSDIERRAAKFAEELKVPPFQTKEPEDLAAVIRDTLLQADTYDRRVFETMGVKTIWIEDWADLPKLIDAVAA